MILQIFGIEKIIGLIIEITALVFGIWIPIKLMKKNPDFLGSKLLAASIAFKGMFALSTLIYDLWATDLAVQIFLRTTLISLVLSVMLLFFAMQVVVKSGTVFLSNKKLIYSTSIVTFVVVFILIFVDYITVTSLEPIVNSDFDTWVSITFMLYILIALISTLVPIYKFGIKKMEGLNKKRLQMFFLGSVCDLIAVFAEILGNFTKYGAYLKMVTFGFIALGMIVVSYSISAKSAKSAKSEYY